jgi:CRISPR/Cas system Type II protein with McrA/HNH and RuvC-like nuclease domain
MYVQYLHQQGGLIIMGKQLSFSFDIGITSIGIAVAEDKNLKYLGVRMFDQAKESKDSRLARSARRNTKRKQWRKKQLRNAFADFGLLSEEELKTPNFGSFTAKSDAFPTPKDRTVYHLRKRALSEQITLRELYLCLLNMLHARGHFNMEMYDFTKEGVLESFWANVDFNKTVEVKPVNENVNPVQSYQNNIIARMKTLRGMNA